LSTFYLQFGYLYRVILMDMKNISIYYSDE
jgi:hypothetical protein